MRRGWLLLAVLALALALQPAEAQSRKLYLDLGSDAAQGLAAGWECSEWHELWPVMCKSHHVDKVGGDGQLRACNPIQIDGERFHIDWVGPTFFLDCGKITEPVGDVTAEAMEDPTCQTWVEIWPDHGKEYHVDEWSDNGNGYLDECDKVILSDGSICHIERIGLNMQVSR